jgi:hypothetical protein
MKIQIKDKQTGIIYSNDMSKENRYSILRIDFTTEGTTFEVQNEEVGDNGKKLFTTKELSVRPDKMDFGLCFLYSVQNNDEAEWVKIN